MSARLRLAVLTTHDAVVAPGKPEFAPFFARLSRLGEIVPFGGDEAELEHCDALLVGGPLRCFGDGMIQGIRAAVDRGLHLLILAHMGGDAAPLVRTGARSNLGKLCDALVFEDTALHVPSSMEAIDNVFVDVAGLHLAGACTIAVSPHAELLMRVGASSHVARNVRRDADMPFIATGDVDKVQDAAVFVRVRQGAGSVTAFSGAYTLGDRVMDGAPFDSAAYYAVVNAWLAEAELSRRQRGAQRHRLLHGYPMRPLGEVTDAYEPPAAGKARSAIVGVLPHAFCNPTVAGCGFCAFPHEKLDSASLRTVVAKVKGEIEAASPLTRSVSALYIGGATANLTPLELLRPLVTAALDKFPAREITLEGVPKYFAIQSYGSLDMLRECSAPARRISMGVQTFDKDRLAAMGRAGFGDRADVEATVNKAHALGIATSGDFLINLPAQSRDAMLSDVDDAIAIGFDQICLYHLVLVPQLDVPWAKNAPLLATLPSNTEACGNWLALREHLLAAGFEQRTLTNFVRKGSPAFLYEELGFAAWDHDTLGFGPAAITRVASADFRSGVKVERATATHDYLAGKQNRRFVYAERDMQLLFLTRGLARLRVEGARFASLFGVSLSEAFGAEINAAKGLVKFDGADLVPTPTGMFYSDAFAGLCAATRIAELTAPRVPSVSFAQPDELWAKLRDPNDASYGSMG